MATSTQPEAAAAALGVHSISVCLSVADLEASAAWYCHNLGFRLAQQRAFTDLAARVAYLEAQGLRLELLEQRDSQPGAPRQDPPRHGSPRGLSQLTFYVADLDAALAHIRDRRVTVAMPPAFLPELGVSAFFVRDPESNLIEFIELSAPHPSKE
ncbi:VOC family protein [Salinactinospora qingdaonensis]|uniref:VOC domain-containing protein n=1 Tax=Salinactinospora qingdaonensis TaxID=702744 RepID=A0ABP7FIT1_9ACTN